MSDLFLGLATAVVKAAYGLWTKDSDFTKEVGSSIIDAVRTKIAGGLEQRKAQRFFEDLEVPVARKLSDLRKYEFNSLPDNEWQAAVIAAGETFNKSALTSETLFSRDLDPLYLERWLRAGLPKATRDLSYDATSFYDRLLSESCIYAIQIADRLPSFHVGAYSEILQRSRAILDGIEELLDRIPQREAGESFEAKFSTAYRRHLATKLDRLEVYGLNFGAISYPLSVAYVSLSVTGRGSNVGRLALQDRLAESPRSLLIARAGAGKTTVLQWLAVRAARGDFSGRLAHLNGCTPFFIRLREYVGKQLPNPEGFIGGIAPLLSSAMPTNWARSLLEDGRALMLIDGVDELPEAQREELTQWLRDLFDLFPRALCVITTRPHAIGEGWLADLNFEPTLLEAMPPTLVRKFVRQWHAAMREEVADSDSRSQLDKFERGLLVAVENDRHLRALADTPLLAGLLCALNYHMRSQLPRRRTEIYEKALAMFDDRDRKRHIMTQQITLEFAVKKNILADLALWLIRNGESEADFDSAIGQVRKSLRQLPGNAEGAPRVFRNLLERSGVLREPASGRIDFVHRTFQEFLAAYAAVNDNMIGELVRNAGDDQWREVTVLATGQATARQCDELLRGLLKRGGHGRQKYKRRLLAVACLQEIPRIDPSLRAEVEAVIPKLLPPQSIEQAELLSAVGERLITLLNQHPPKQADEAAATVRAASLIGGRSALELISRIAGRYGTDNSVMPEILRAWQYFDAEEYSSQIRPRIDTEQLSISDPTVLPSLPNFPSLRRLIIEEVDPDLELSPIPDIRNLKSLTLLCEERLFPNLNPLKRCPSLEELRLLDISNADLTGLPRGPDNLHSLIIRRALHLRSLAGIQSLLNLESLSLYTCPGLDDLDALGALPALSSVSFNEMSDPDLSWIANSDSIGTLRLMSCGNVDCSPLADSTNRICVYYDQDTVLLQVNRLPSPITFLRVG
ncbi:NACHT domain-containing protein [Nonomuraea sp. NPDC049419]|uniref:NACHT domain-containing protein n=1 Tax=Nonomuraea sp. NPDC049419 TaxID=3155772 RepID=UPI00343F93E0